MTFTLNVLWFCGNWFNWTRSNGITLGLRLTSKMANFHVMSRNQVQRPEAFDSVKRGASVSIVSREWFKKLIIFITRVINRVFMTARINENKHNSDYARDITFFDGVCAELGPLCGGKDVWGRPFIICKTNAHNFCAPANSSLTLDVGTASPAITFRPPDLWTKTSGNEKHSLKGKTLKWHVKFSSAAAKLSSVGRFEALLLKVADSNIRYSC